MNLHISEDKQLEKMYIISNACGMLHTSLLLQEVIQRRRKQFCKEILNILQYYLGRQVDRQVVHRLGRLYLGRQVIASQVGSTKVGSQYLVRQVVPRSTDSTQLSKQYLGRQIVPRLVDSNQGVLRQVGSTQVVPEQVYNTWVVLTQVGSIK